MSSSIAPGGKLISAVEMSLSDIGMKLIDNWPSIA